MGRIEAFIPDNLETKFRLEMTRRFGGKKGDLQRSLIDAIRLWVSSGIIEQLKQKALSTASTIELRSIVDTMVMQGKDALYALGEILNNKESTTEVAYIIKAIQGLTTDKSPQEV